MENTLIGALLTLSSLQRWNFLPRAETWTEAENVAYMTHVGYAVGRTTAMEPRLLEHFLLRSILKSFNKHILSDIPLHIKDALKRQGEDDQLWHQIVDRAASDVSELFPRNISKKVKGYLTHAGDYCDNPDEKTEIEDLVTYAQAKVAQQECETNKKVYSDPQYDEISKHIEAKIKSLRKSVEYEEAFTGDPKYFASIKRLKYLRRWNRINRFIENSVLSHTFLVAFLALLFSLMVEDEGNINKTEGNFHYTAILRALFHDVPESKTGDLISPVKAMIEDIKRGAWSGVEEQLVNDIKMNAPNGVIADIDSLNLLVELKPTEPYSLVSLVKDCDRLAILIECLFENHSGKSPAEMVSAYKSYLKNLMNSEWHQIREFCVRISLEFPLKIQHG